MAKRCHRAGAHRCRGVPLAACRTDRCGSDGREISYLTCRASWHASAAQCADHVARIVEPKGAAHGKSDREQGHEPHWHNSLARYPVRSPREQPGRQSDANQAQENQQ